MRSHIYENTNHVTRQCNAILIRQGNEISCIKCQHWYLTPGIGNNDSDSKMTIKMTAPVNSRLNVVVRSPNPFGLGRNGCWTSRRSQLPRELSFTFSLYSSLSLASAAALLTFPLWHRRRPNLPFLSAASNAILKPAGLLRWKVRLVKDARLSLPLTEVMKIARLTSPFLHAPRQSSPRPRLRHGRRLALLFHPNQTQNL